MEKLLSSTQQRSFQLNKGQQVTGEVISVSDSEVILDLKQKSEGVINKRDLDTTQIKDIKVNDQISAFVLIPENESGQVVLSQYRNQASTTSSTNPRSAKWNKFLNALNHKTKLTGTALEVNKGGLVVEIDGIRGFLPTSQVSFNTDTNLEKLVGKNIEVLVIEVDANSNRLVLSQRGKASEEILKKLEVFKPGQKVTGKIVAVLPFGLSALLEGSVEGLVHISDIAWERVEELDRRYQVGEEIEAQVISVDTDLGRVNLSVKLLSSDPFDKLAEQLQPDDVARGKVSKVTDSGIFILLDVGLEGFLPKAKLESAANYQNGQEVQVLVDNIDTQRRRITLAPFLTSTAGLIYK